MKIYYDKFNISKLKENVQYKSQEFIEADDRDLYENKIDLSKCDIFSLGITVYRLMTIRQINSLPTNGEFWYQLRNNAVPFLDDIYSKELTQLVRKMLDQDPLLRPSA